MSEEKNEKSEARKGGAVKWIVRALIALALLLALHPLWLGLMVKTAANVIGPKLTKTEFRIDSMSINLYALDIRFEGLKVGNPEPFVKSEARAAAVGSFQLDLAWGGLLSKRIHVQELLVNEVFASYLHEKDRTNVDVLKVNALGEKPPTNEREEDPNAPQVEEKTEKDPIRIRVDHMKIDNISAKILNLPLAVPIPLELDGIGASTDGVTIPEFCNIFCNAVLNAAGNIAGALGNLGMSALGSSTNLLNDAASSATAAVGNALDAVVNTDLTEDGVKATEEVLKDTGRQLEKAGKTLKKLFK